MFGIMGTSAAFAQAAGVKKQINMLSFVSGDEDLSIWQVSCDGEIVVKTIKGGEEKEVIYTDLAETTVALENDANTKVEIIGNVTKIKFYDADSDDGDPINISSLNVKKCKTLTYLQCSYCTGLSSLDISANTALTEFNCSYCTGLSSLDLSTNTALTEFNCSYCTGLSSLDLSTNTALIYFYCENCTGLSSLDLSTNTALIYFYCNNCTGLSSLDLSTNTALTEFNCSYCTGLSSLDISANTALTYFYCNNCTGLSSISYPATNSDVSTAVAGAITAATADDGTVYTDSQGAYYSTIADAATAKGWTIAPLA